MIPQPNNQPPQEECNHHFEFACIKWEATQENITYRDVAYSVCVKCGEVKRNELWLPPNQKKN